MSGPVNYNNSRIVEFDYIRVISLVGILLCHSLFECNGFDWLGRYFALTFNFLFLILSAFLIGIAWDIKGRKAYKKDFLWKRIGKLSRTYYPYLALLFIFLYLSQGYFSIKNIVSHLLYLSWFDKIDGFGHLWFMTMIVICYFGVYLITKLQNRVHKYKSLLYSALIGGYFVRLYS